MGLKTNINNGPESMALREELMNAVSEAMCSDEQVLNELAAALACSCAFAKLWTRDEMLEAVATLYDVALEVEEVKTLNPFIGFELENPPEA